MPTFRSRIDTSSATYQDNRAQMLALVEQLRQLTARTAARSNAKADFFASRGQLLPRERLTRLLDPGTPFVEIGNLGGYLRDTDDESTSIPGGAQLIGIGFVSGTRCMIIANDSGINAGALTPPGGEKFLRAQRLALENQLPLVMLVESAGANLLETQVEFFVGGGAFYANMARLSAAGLPVITVLHGSSTAGGAYFPGMSDVVIGVRGRGKAFLAGPPLLKAATGEIADDESLGGIDMHATTSGLVEYVAEDDNDGIRIAREVIARMQWGRSWLPEPLRDFAEPRYDPDELCGIVPLDYRQPYDMREVAARIVDGSELLDFKPGYGPATVCLDAEVHGYRVGIIGNNGPIDNEGATKATHFIHRCTQLGTPLVFLQNTTGYMVGTATEQRGMVKHGSKMIQAVTNAPVPRFTFMIGASFGAGNYGMCGRGYDPRFLFTWPNARTGLMGGAQAATTMRIVAEQRAARKGEALDEDAVNAYVEQIVRHHEAQQSAFVTSGRGLDDGMIDPRDTRRVLGFLLATTHEADTSDVNPMTFAVARP
ncbi:MAG: acyl-CoA carboxylase subunit beta [Nitriliruptor sp.]|nr:MAG: acyl-CoA carboxylase subunit beta [Nitriliruptor sp.]